VSASIVRARSNGEKENVFQIQIPTVVTESESREKKL
jgi:hypothetical protein